MSKKSTEEIFQRSRELYHNKEMRKRALEAAKKNKMVDLTLDVVQKRKLNITPGRTYE